MLLLINIVNKRFFAIRLWEPVKHLKNKKIQLIKIENKLWRKKPTH